MVHSIHTLDPEILFKNVVVDGDNKAFEKLFVLFYPSLSIYANRYIEQRTVCEDIVQEVFALLWENRKNMSIRYSIRSYLIAAVKNHCLNYLKKEGLVRQYQEAVIKKHLTSEGEEEDFYLWIELYEILNKTLEKLPEPYRIVFEMHRMEGKNYDEIAEQLHVSVRTVKRYKGHVMEILKKELKDYLPLLFLIHP